jgi:hypothetical protein
MCLYCNGKGYVKEYEGKGQSPSIVECDCKKEKENEDD